jgi:hypothetical protein
MYFLCKFICIIRGSWNIGKLVLVACSVGVVSGGEKVGRIRNLGRVFGDDCGIFHIAS